MHQKEGLLWLLAGVRPFYVIYLCHPGKSPIQGEFAACRGIFLPTFVYKQVKTCYTNIYVNHHAIQGSHKKK